MCDTPLTQWFVDQSDEPEVVRRELTTVAPLGRMGTADEIANATLFLSSDASSYTAGTCLVCDGGVLIR